jgi:hypothetical protein
LVKFSLFYNLPPPFSVPIPTSPIPHAYLLYIFLNRLKPPQLRLS